MTRTAHSLWNPAATRSAHTLDVSYIPHESDEEMVRVVIRQCDYNDFRDMTLDEARADYRRRLGLGFKPMSEPRYDRVEFDRFNRITALHPIMEAR